MDTSGTQQKVKWVGNEGRTGGRWGEWEIETKKCPILSCHELNSFQETLGTSSPLPEMVFGNNCIRFTHTPSKLVLSFNTLDALRQWSKAKTPSSLKVAYAHEWTGKAERSDCPELEFDWTYNNTEYRGSIAGQSGTVGAPIPTDQSVNIALLQRQDPISFYDDVVLYEDELHDNGIALYSIRMRVMPTCFFCLARFWLRVDGVLLRIADTRVYYEHGSDFVVREWTLREDTVEDFEKANPPSADPSVASVTPFSDPNQIYSLLTLRESVKEEIPIK